MTQRYFARPAHRAWIVAIVAVLSVGWLWAKPVEAAKELDQLDSALKWIPEDAAFFSTMLRNREQIEAIAASRAWSKLRSMPIVQMGLQMYQMQAGSPESVPGKINQALDNPQVQDLLNLLADMFSDEVFLYGDADMVDFAVLVQEAVGATRYGPVMMQISGRMGHVDNDKIQAALLLAVLADNVDRVKVPGIVIGFKLEDTTQATVHLGKLEMIAAAVLGQNPMLADCFKRTEIDGYSYLTFTLEGKMVPWDEVPLDKLRELELHEGDVDKLIAKLKKETLVIAMGLREGYLLLSIGSSTEPLERLGKGDRLIDRPELEPLAKFADKRLVSIGYISKEMHGRIAGGKKDIDDVLTVVREMLPQAGLGEDAVAEIRKDATALADDIKRLMPEPGAMTGLSFLADRGIESYAYYWGEQPQLDGSQPLGLLNHLGGYPVLAVVSRSKVSVDDYDLMVKWLKKGYGYFEKYGLPNMNPSERAKFERLAELSEPLLVRLDTANRELLLPALEDGQSALVIDTKITSKQFIKTLPATDEAMPMIEPAIVIGITNADLMRRGLTEYWEVFKGLVDAVLEVAPDPPEITIPEPETIETELGEIFAFKLPESWGVDKQITPNVGLAENVVVFSFSRNHTERLLGATPFKVGGVLDDLNRPRAMAICFDWAGLVTAATPWVDFAARQIINEKSAGAPPEAVEAQLKAIRDQVHTALEVLKVLRTVTSESYLEGKAVVTHTLTEIRDVE